MCRFSSIPAFAATVVAFGFFLYPTLLRAEDLDCPSEEYCQAIQPGNVEDQLAHARQFAERQDPGNALDWYRRAADNGSQEAMVALAFMLTEEVFIRRDLSEADRLFGRARQQGEDSAQYLLGQEYLRWGQRLHRQDWIDKSTNWFRQAAALGNKLAEQKLAALPAVSKVFNTVQVSSNSPDAIFKLGLVYKIGSKVEGITKNPHRAAELFRQASEMGHACAKNELGMMYLQGLGVSQNDATGIGLIKEATGKCGLAVFNMGLLYEAGRGVPQDVAEAERWFNKAERGGWGPETEDAIEQRQQKLVMREKAAATNANRLTDTVVALGYLGVIYLLSHPSDTPASVSSDDTPTFSGAIDDSAQQLAVENEQEEQAERERQDQLNDEMNARFREDQEQSHNAYMEQQNSAYPDDN